MLFERAEVPPALAGVITDVWLLDMPRAHVEEQVLPMPATEFIVNLSEPYVLVDDPRWAPTPAVFRTGVRSGVVRFANPSRLRHVAVRMPIHGPSRFGLPPTTTLSAVEGPLGAALTTVAEAADRAPNVLLTKTIGALSAHLLPETEPVRTVRCAVDALSADPTRSIAALASAIGITHKTLIARFRRFTGITPSRLTQLVMVDRLIQTIPTDGPLPTWTQLVADSPYADQSHFIRSFTHLIGLTPRRYLDALARSRYADPRFLDSGEG